MAILTMNQSTLQAPKIPVAGTGFLQQQTDDQNKITAGVSDLPKPETINSGSIPKSPANGGINPDRMYSTPRDAIGMSPIGSTNPLSNASQPNPLPYSGEISDPRKHDPSSGGFVPPKRFLSGDVSQNKSYGSGYLNDATDTVEGIIGRLTSENSDYRNRARSRGMQVANERGLPNSSLAAGASEAAAMDAALPIAQADAATYSGFAQRRQQSDLSEDANQNQRAHERSMEEYKQDTLAYSQFLQGVSQINSQDMSQTQKDQAIRNLWDMYLQGRPVASSLRGVQIKNGQVIYPEDQSTNPAPQPTPQPAPKGPAPNPSNPLSYGSISEMPADVRSSYVARYGNTEPGVVNGLQQVVAYAKDKFAGYLKPKSWYGAYGVSLDSMNSRNAFVDYVRSEAAKAGLPSDEASLARILGGGTRNPQDMLAGGYLNGG